MQEGDGVQSTKTAVTPQVALDVTRIGGTYQLTSIESNIPSFTGPFNASDVSGHRSVGTPENLVLKM